MGSGNTKQTEIARELRLVYEEQTAADTSDEVTLTLLIAKFNEIVTNEEQAKGDVFNVVLEEENSASERLNKSSSFPVSVCTDDVRNDFVMSSSMTAFESLNLGEGEDDVFEKCDAIAAENDPPQVVDPWTKTLDMRSGEVEFLLRRPMNNDEDIEQTLVAAEAGLQFVDQLNQVAESVHLQRGTLSRWLLPFDTSTSVSEQQSVYSSVAENIPGALHGKITEDKLKYLVDGVNGVRKLVRVKIADDNDLRTATEALQTTSKFLKRLQTTAQKLNDNGQQVTPFSLLQEHNGY